MQRSLILPPLNIMLSFLEGVVYSNIFQYKTLIETVNMTEQEFTVRIPPRNEKKNYHIMKFNASMNVDVGKWTQVCSIRVLNLELESKLVLISLYPPPLYTIVGEIPQNVYY